MISQLDINPPLHDRRIVPVESTRVPNLVTVSSEPMKRGHEGGVRQPAQAVSFRVRGVGTEPQRVKYTRIAAHSVAGSAVWLRCRGSKARVRDLTAGAVGISPGGLSQLPLASETNNSVDHKEISRAIVSLRTADAAIAGPLSADDANAPGLLVHLADMARLAYRALRPPRELIAHPGFAQVARRFQFIQMTHHNARSLAAGAIDIGILAHRLRQLQGAGGEFAITAFGSHGLLWAENCFWEIDPIGDDVNEVKAGAAFCSAWVVARRFLVAPASQALAYACAAAANSIRKH